MFNRIHSNNNYLIHVIYFVLCSAVEPMTTLSWQLCKQVCYQVGYGIWRMFVFMSVMVTVLGSVGIFVV